jgi:hypothetical protein
VVPRELRVRDFNEHVEAWHATWCSAPPTATGERRQGSVGLPTTEMAIVDDQCELASGASGEVAVRGRSGTAPTDG